MFLTLSSALRIRNSTPGHAEKWDEGGRNNPALGKKSCRSLGESGILFKAVAGQMDALYLDAQNTFSKVTHQMSLIHPLHSMFVLMVSNRQKIASGKWSVLNTEESYQCCLTRGCADREDNQRRETDVCKIMCSEGGVLKTFVMLYSTETRP